MATADGDECVQQESKATEAIEASGVVSSGVSATTSVVTTTLVLGAIALIEPELIAGMAIGAAVTLLSGRMISLAAVWRPVVKAAVRAAYSTAEVVAQASEEIQDLVAEARAEYEQPPSSEEPHITH